jgi:hypothetical protein
LVHPLLTKIVLIGSIFRKTSKGKAMRFIRLRDGTWARLVTTASGYLWVESLERRP